MRELQQFESFSSLSEWLNLNLKDSTSFVPHLDEIPNIKSKGVYFWFMHPEGYKKLSNFVEIKPVIPAYKKIVNGIEHDLVYLGTAGTGKEGNSNLQERFKWHVNQKHTRTNICHGTLSTLRAGLGALLSEDLIKENTEELVNDFMKKYMKVFSLEYQNYSVLIDGDEKSLINNIKPLLNLKNNPNTRVNGNTTQLYKSRRELIYKNSKFRLNCLLSNETDNKTLNSKKEKLKEYMFIMDKEEFHLTYFDKPRITKDGVVQKVLPLLKKFILQNNLEITFKDKKNIDKTTNTLSNDFLKYFSSQNEATGSIIENIPSLKFAKKTSLLNKNQIDFSKNFKVVMICASEKNDGILSYNNKEINFYSNCNREENEFLPDNSIELGSLITWRDYVVNNQKLIRYSAYELYKKDAYKYLYQKYKNNFYILSAGWGLVRADFRLPKYNITFSLAKKVAQKFRRNQNIASFPTYKDFNQLKCNSEEDIVYIGGKDYLNLFYTLTEKLSNKKIIYFYGEGIIERKNGYTYIQYFPTKPNDKRRWYYELANEI